MHKKLFTIALSAILVVSMAVPTMAGAFTPATRASKQYWANLQNLGTRHGNETEYLNISRVESGVLYSEKNLITYDSRSSDDQKFQVNVGGDGYVISKVTGPNGEQYAVNVYRGTTPYNCTLYPLSGNHNDAYVKINGSNVISIYHNYKRMTVAGNNGNVYWSDSVTPNSSWDMFNVG